MSFARATSDLEEKPCESCGKVSETL